MGERPGLRVPAKSFGCLSADIHELAPRPRRITSPGGRHCLAVLSVIAVTKQMWTTLSSRPSSIWVGWMPISRNVGIARRDHWTAPRWTTEDRTWRLTCGHPSPLLQAHTFTALPPGARNRPPPPPRGRVVYTTDSPGRARERPCQHGCATSPRKQLHGQSERAQRRNVRPQTRCSGRLRQPCQASTGTAPRSPLPVRERDGMSAAAVGLSPFRRGRLHNRSDPCR